MAPKELIVMRHAKSSWTTAHEDLERPLSARGTRDAVVAGEILRDYHIDLALCSTARRAEQTWQCAVMGGAAAEHMRSVAALYTADAAEIVDGLKPLPPALRTVLLIGHEPACSELILNLAVPNGLTERVSRKFPTSAIAVLRLSDDWAGLGPESASLERLEIPRG